MVEFNLNGLRQGISSKTEELSEDARVRSFDDNARPERMKPFTFQESSHDRTEAPKDEMRKYWRQFETTPIIQKPIESFASSITEPGYYLESQSLSVEQLRELDEWLEKCAIIEGERGKNFRLLLKKLIIQREVKGTAFVEKAPDRNDDSLVAGFKLINAETMEANTVPGRAILLEPEDIKTYPDAPKTEKGMAAAYLQDLGETNTYFGRAVERANPDANGEFKIGFERSDILKFTRNADVGEIFGTSRIESVSDRIDGLKKKLNDNDEAISSKAYPLWVFLFGTPEHPWRSDDIDEFMRAHEMENFHPGMKQGVRGDVDIKTISGEVAEIAEYLQFDIDWIMSNMPMPTYALGAFGDAVGQFGGIAQQQNVNRQINEARQEISDEFTPVIREVALQKGFPEDAVKDLRLIIGTPGEPETEVPQRENVIRYVPNSKRNPGTQDGVNTSADDPSTPSTPSTPSIPEEEDVDDPLDTLGAMAWHDPQSVEQLAHYGPDAYQTRLANEIASSMKEARDNVLEEVGMDFDGMSAFAVSNFENTANSVLRRTMRRGAFRARVEPIVTDTITETEESLRTETGAFSRNQDIRYFVQDIENASEDAIEEMLRLIRIQVRRSALSNEPWDPIEKRVRQSYNDGVLRQRAELIAHMELSNARETTKLKSYESDPDVIGVRVVNQNPSTPLTQSLNGAEIFFDDGDIRAQLESRTRREYLHKGFDPIPPSPPFHFNDTTTYEPIYDNAV